MYPNKSTRLSRYQLNDAFNLVKSIQLQSTQVAFDFPGVDELARLMVSRAPFTFTILKAQVPDRAGRRFFSTKGTFAIRGHVVSEQVRISGHDHVSLTVNEFGIATYIATQQWEEYSGSGCDSGVYALKMTWTVTIRPHGGATYTTT